MNPKISIIIPVWNGGKYLAMALESVATQSFSNWECVCIDNNSADGSDKVLREFSARDPRFIVITNDENLGASGGRNIGMDAARGEYITFLDQDDLMARGVLENYARIIDDRRPDMIRCLCKYVAEDFRILTDFSPQDIRVQYFNTPQKDFIEIASNKKRYGLWMFVWVCCFRRDAVRGIRFDTNMFVGGGEDNIFMADVIDNIKNFAQTDMVAVYYRASPASQSMHGFKESLVTAYSAIVPTVWLKFAARKSDWHEFILNWTAARFYRMCVKRTVLENANLTAARAVIGGLSRYLPVMKKYLGWRRWIYVKLFMRGNIKLLRFLLRAL